MSRVWLRWMGLGLGAATLALAAERPPNIVFVLADDLGWGELGCYGQTTIRTPHADRLASEGLRFTRHYSGSPVCAPSRCVLMTGLHPGRAPIRNNREEEPEGQYDLPAGIPTLIEQLRRRGYATGLFGKWGLGTLGGPGDPSARGFERWFGYLCQRHAHSLYPEFLRDDGRRFPLRNNPPVPGHSRFPEGLDPFNLASYAAWKGRDYAPSRIREAALEFIRRHRDRPFFLYYANVLPHLALMVPDEDLQPYLERGWDDAPYLGDRGYTPHRYPRAAYAAMVSRLDADLGAVLDELSRLGLERMTLVILTSDNGPTHDVGGADTSFFNSSGGLRGRKGSLDEGGIRVPCIVRWPGHTPAGTSTDALTGFEDWMPTLLEIVGETVPSGLSGISLRSLLMGGAAPVRPFLYREFPGNGGWQAVWQGPWKAIRRDLARRARTGQPMLTELYHLEEDPAETQDRAAQHPDIVSRLEQIMREEHMPCTDFPLPGIDSLPSRGAGSRK